MSGIIQQAMEGLKQDDGGLAESDSRLRDEIINSKLDYLTDIVGALSRLVVEIRGVSPRKAVQHYNDAVEESRARAIRLTAHSIEQYKERKQKDV